MDPLMRRWGLLRGLTRCWRKAPRPARSSRWASSVSLRSAWQPWVPSWTGFPAPVPRYCLGTKLLLPSGPAVPGMCLGREAALHPRVEAGSCLLTSVPFWNWPWRLLCISRDSVTSVVFLLMTRHGRLALLPELPGLVPCRYQLVRATLGPQERDVSLPKVQVHCCDR